MASIYYKTLKTSEVGLKLQKLKNTGIQTENEISRFVKLLGGDKKYLVKGRTIFGTGLAGIMFTEEPDKKIWKSVKGFPNYFQPRLSSKEGKELQSKFNSFVEIERCDIGETFGYKDFFRNPGFSDVDEMYFNIVMDSDWNFTMPDCFIEITYSEFKNLNLKK